MNVENNLADASRIGADLRAARERLGWSLEHVAASLRIRYPYLLAIEEGRVSELPGNAYALGFVRTYAASLGLDPDEVARRFRAEAKGVNRRTELQFPVPVPQRGVPAGVVVLLGLVIAFGAYVGWYHYSGAHRGTETVQDVPASMAPNEAGPAQAPAHPAQPNPSSTATTAPTPPAPDAAPAESPTAAAAATPPPSSPLSSPTSPPLAADGGSPAGAAPATASPTPASPNQAEAAAAAPAAAPAAPPDSSQIVIKATADAWVQVREPHGQVLYNHILHPGDTWTVPAQTPGEPPLLLTTGNAGGTELDVGGTTTAPLGPSGSVRHDIPLDPALFKDGKAPPGAPPGHAAASPDTAASQD